MTDPCAADSGDLKHTAARRLPKRLTASSFHDIESLKRVKPSEQGLPPAAQRTPARTLTFNPLHAPFRTFKTQQAAFDFLDQQECSSILRTFAVETATSGQRDFIVSSAQLFWQHYIELPIQQRHHYEIIRQGSPCNLYFDLEFCPECNKGVVGPRLVQLLVSGVQQLFQELFDIALDPSKHVLELDSSTAAKFSRHVIITLPGHVFADACHAGRFARCVLLRLLCKAVHSSQHAHMLVHNKEGGLTSFVDMGVYTRNRAFRLYLSSKFGKTAVLRLTHRFGGTSRCPKVTFQDALVSVLQPPAVPSRHTSNTSTAAKPCTASTWAPTHSITASSRTCSTRNGSSTELRLLYMDTDGQQELLLLPPEWQQLRMLQLRPLQHNTPGQHPATAASPQLSPALPGSGSMLAAGPAVPRPSLNAASLAIWSQPCYGPSPFPALDAFITSICCGGGVQGEVRSWLLQAGSACVVYNIKGNRWCGNVGRAHKSNGIFFCVDLHAGVYYQKCYDPECRHYRSSTMPLPGDVWQAYRHLVQQQGQQQDSHQQLQVMSSASATAAATAAAAGCEEDDALLLLLLLCEQQHQQHLQQQHEDGSSTLQQLQCHAEQEGHLLHEAHAGTYAAHGGPVELPEAHQDAAECADAAGCSDDLDMNVGTAEDELYMQLLQAVEEQHVAQQGHKIAASS